MLTLLEHLPNELFLELFRYISLRDLYYSFLKLNKRFNRIIQSLNNLSFIIYKNDQLLIDMFAERIIRLEVINHYDIIDLKQFPNLYSLKLNQAIDNQLKQIRHEFMPNLMYLFISISSVTSASIELAQNLFSNKLPSLRYVDLGQIIVSDMSSWSLSSSLHSLCIHCTEPSLIRMILQTCPNLKRFEVNMFNNNQRFDLSTIPLNHNLKHFILFDSVHALSLETVNNILLFIPNIKQLYLRYYCGDNFFALAKILLQRLKYLIQFDCDIVELPSDMENDNLDIIRQIHPCFNRLLCTIRHTGHRLFTTDDIQRKTNLFV